MLFFGREVHSPLDVTIKTPSTDAESSDDYVSSLLDRLRNAYCNARTELQTVTNVNKRYFDMSVKPSSFQIDDWVWFYRPRHVPGRATKWENFYSGPFKVVDKLSSVNYVSKKV